MLATIVTNREFLPSYYRMCLQVPGLAPAFMPGQFVMVRPSSVGDPFLPRAFSIQRARSRARGGHGRGPRPLAGAAGGDARARKDEGRGPGAGGEIEIVYRALGRGTTLMAALGRGNPMEILGPLGRGFRPGPGPVVLVGGGVGIPPLVALAERLAHRGSAAETRRRPSRNRELLVFVGGRTRHDVLGVADFRRAGCRVQVATDDGSAGHHGLVTALLERWLERGGHGDGDETRPTVYACGPEGMLKAVRRIALAAGVPCQLCLEANMACGFGGCMGCAVPVRGEGMEAFKLCCVDGPVFEARELRW